MTSAMKPTALKRRLPAAERQVRAVVICRPPVLNDRRLLPPGADALLELEVLPPAEALPAGAPDADLLRDICLAREGAKEGATLRLPLFGYHGGAGGAQLCVREVAPLLRRLLAGESAAVIAYGQTGSGKSYTMGTERYDEGQAPAPHSGACVGAVCCAQVFELARQEGVRGLEVSFAAIEIHREGKDKERVFDLQTLERKRIESFEGQASWQRAEGPQELQRKLLGAAFLRNTDRTDGNARSSRSHAIFVIQVQFKLDQEGGGMQRAKARLMLVDLAGSERASLAAAGSATQKQGAGINTGLLFLGICIKELAAKGQTLSYRNSLLTELLRPALGGGSNEVASSCNTLIVGCISPLAVHLNNTRTTLEFLQDCSSVKNVVRPDVQMLRQHELEAQVKQLEQQLQGLQLQLAKQQRAAAAQGAPGSAGGSAEGSPQPGALLQQASEDELGAAGGGGAAAAAAAADERAAELARELATVRQELVVQRDRADEFERLLRQQMEAAAAAQAAAAAAAAAQAAAAQAAEAAADTAAEQGEAPGSAAGAPARLSAGAAATPGAYAAASPLLALAGGAPALAGTPLTGGRPSAAFLAASPLLAASRGVAEWMTDAAAAEAATPAGETLPLLRLLPSAEALCCQEESHMAPEELRALQDKVERLLGGAEGGDDRAQARAFGEAALYALLAYNKCLGQAITAAEDAEEDRLAQEQQQAALFQQLFDEKAMYMKRTAAAERGLAEYESQIEELKDQLAASQEALHQAQQAAQQGTPSRWGTLGRLITGSGGPESRRTSGSGGGGAGSPGASPRASLGAGRMAQQQLFGSPSRLGQTSPGAAAAGAPDNRRATIACVRRLSGQDEAAAAAAHEAALARKQHRKSAAAVLCDVPVEGGGGLIKAVAPPGAASEQPVLPQQAQQDDGMQADEQPPSAQLEGELVTPLESPVVSCIASASNSGGSEAAEPAEPLAAADAGAEAAPVDAAPEDELLPVASMPSPSPPAVDPEQLELADAFAEQQQEQQQQQQQQQPEQPAHQAPPADAPPPAPKQEPPQTGPAAAPQPPPPLLPGPRLSVFAPRGQGGRGRQQPAWQPFEWDPSSGRFFEPESDTPAYPLRHMALAEGQPWQQRMLVGSSAITVDCWLQRRMLRRGRCHFCCSEAPAPGCAHPEPAFSQLQLCGECHEGLEPEGWKSGDTWLSDDPADPGFRWCCLCGGAGVGCTDRLIMCSKGCLNGFCSGCLWRFTDDDLAVVQSADDWCCPLCRPAPQLHLAYAEEEEQPAALRGADSGGSSRGRSTGRGAARSTSRAQPVQPRDEAAAAAGLRRSSRRQQPETQQRAETPEFDDFVIDLTSSTSEGSSAEESPPPRRQRQRQQGQRTAPRARGGATTAKKKAGGGRAATAAAPAEGGDAQPDGSQQAAAARKRRLLARGDLSSPGDGELPAHAHQRQRMRPQLQQMMASQRQGLQASQHHQASRLRELQGL